ncbi:MAG: PrsW family glutamic-type intramembrane protease [Methanomassiliicoccales archaeon]|jgi:RsiW-degrading membrane proteinase PrsW (M82 family)|nr:PrsW family glutamic-type intramembrane protease [Methanomassiliicoccales archaeon]
MEIGTLEIIAVILVALTPSVLYILWIRNTEMCKREPLSFVFLVLFYGSTAAFGIAFVIETSLIYLLFENGSLLNRFIWGIEGPSPQVYLFLLAVVIAPIVEEFVKASGVFLAYRRLAELEDGMIYGAAAGLGFAAAENVIYFGDALLAGFEVFLVTAVLRTLTSTVLHASSTAISGYGIGKAKLFRQIGRRSRWLQYVILAVIIHALFNFFAILGVIFSQGMEIYFAGLIASFAIATIAFRIMKLKIREFDMMFPGEKK